MIDLQIRVSQNTQAAPMGAAELLIRVEHFVLRQLVRNFIIMIFFSQWLEIPRSQKRSGTVDDSFGLFASCHHICIIIATPDRLQHEFYLNHILD